MLKIIQIGAGGSGLNFSNILLKILLENNNILKIRQLFGTVEWEIIDSDTFEYKNKVRQNVNIEGINEQKSKYLKNVLQTQILEYITSITKNIEEGKVSVNLPYLINYKVFKQPKAFNVPSKWGIFDIMYNNKLTEKILNGRIKKDYSDVDVTNLFYSQSIYFTRTTDEEAEHVGANLTEFHAVDLSINDTIKSILPEIFDRMEKQEPIELLLPNYTNMSEIFNNIKNLITDYINITTKNQLIIEKEQLMKLIQETLQKIEHRKTLINKKLQTITDNVVRRQYIKDTFELDLIIFVSLVDNNLSRVVYEEFFSDIYREMTQIPVLYIDSGNNTTTVQGLCHGTNKIIKFDYGTNPNKPSELEGCAAIPIPNEEVAQISICNMLSGQYAALSINNFITKLYKQFDKAFIEEHINVLDHNDTHIKDLIYATNLLKSLNIKNLFKDILTIDYYSVPHSVTQKYYMTTGMFQNIQVSYDNILTYNKFTFTNSQNNTEILQTLNRLHHYMQTTVPRQIQLLFHYLTNKFLEIIKIRNISDVNFKSLYNFISKFIDTKNYITFISDLTTVTQSSEYRTFGITVQGFTAHLNDFSIPGFYNTHNMDHLIHKYFDRHYVMDNSITIDKKSDFSPLFEIMAPSHKYSLEYKKSTKKYEKITFTNVQFIDSINRVMLVNNLFLSEVYQNIPSSTKVKNDNLIPFNELIDGISDTLPDELKRILAYGYVTSEEALLHLQDKVNDFINNYVFDYYVDLEKNIYEIGKDLTSENH